MKADMNTKHNNEVTSLDEGLAKFAKVWKEASAGGLEKRLNKNREMTTVTMRIPVDVVESLKDIAARNGLSSYRTLLKYYISEGLRKDEALSRFFNPRVSREIHFS